MIVVVVIGILLSIAIPNYTGLLQRARKTACLANQRAIEMARMYRAIGSGDYGASMADLNVVFGEVGFIGDSNENDLNCPDGGSYLFSNSSYEVSCSILAHND